MMRVVYELRSSVFRKLTKFLAVHQVHISAIKPASLGPLVGPPPMSSIINGVYQSEDGAEVRSMAGYENLFGQGITVSRRGPWALCCIYHK